MNNEQFNNMKFWEKEKMGKDESNKFDSETIDDDSEYNEPIDISKDQWVEMLKNTDIFTMKDRKLILNIFDRGGKATATEIALENNTHLSSYNMPVVMLAKRIQQYTNCKVPMRKNGKERWWHVPFNGKYEDDGHFSWILRPELKHAIKDIYDEISKPID